jgi:uncharacterized protein (UPF0216 family)
MILMKNVIKILSSIKYKRQLKKLKNVHSNHKSRAKIVVQLQIESVNRKLLNSSKKSRLFFINKMLGKDNNKIRLKKSLKFKGNYLENRLSPQIAKKFGKIALKELKVFTLQQVLEAAYGLEAMQLSNH